MKKKSNLAAWLLGLTFTACGANEAEQVCTVPEGQNVDWISELGCDSDYSLLWTESEDAIFAHTKSINWLVDQEDNDKVYFIDTNDYPLHFFFAEAYLEYGTPFTPVGTHSEFNLLNYRRQARRFLLGKLVRYQDQNLVTLELSAGDTANAEQIIKSFELVKANIFDGDALVYRPVSATQEAVIGELTGKIPLIETDRVFAGQVYQPLNDGIGYGTLRFRKLAELGANPVGPTDIVVLDRVPNDISLVSGIITEEFQTPLAHINVLSKNRGTPNMASRGAYSTDALRTYDGKLVKLQVARQTFTIEEATLSDAQDYWDSLRPANPLIPVFDESPQGLVDLRAVGVSDVVRVGAKAANIGELFRIVVDDQGLNLPKGTFALPFRYYTEHMMQSGANIKVSELLNDLQSGELEQAELEKRLFEIRWTIFSAPMNRDTRDMVMTTLAENFAAKDRLRFRSSTNVEDLPEFSGAGLYTSAGAEWGDGPVAIENAIKVAWASTFNDQAFIERDFYRVDQTKVRMAVLIHEGFPDEVANGVAVTINEFAENRPAFYINSQVGEVSVTNPTGQAVPEQILYYTWYETPEIEVITRSSLVDKVPNWPGGKSVLTDDELAQLGDALNAIHFHFKPLFRGGKDFAMDVEFKLDTARKLVIKQARPLRQK